MNKLGGTADNVMNLLPDLRAGVEENEPEFAAHLFAQSEGMGLRSFPFPRDRRYLWVVYGVPGSTGTTGRL